MAASIIWSEPAPADATGVEIYFAPTRSRLLRVQVRGEPPTDVRPGTGLRVERIWGPNAARPVEIELWYQGERPQALQHVWQTPLGWDSPLNDEPYAELSRRRKVEADANPFHAFFFELDRNTLAEYLEHNLDVAEAVKQSRTKALECIHPMLAERLNFRRVNAGMIPPAIGVSDPVIADLSNIFWKATDALFPGQANIPENDRFATVGEALERFAAGRLRKLLTFEEHNQDFPEKPWKSVLISEPDSFFVFFFAEFATVAIQVGDPRAAWWSAILPSAVRMQRFFVERYRLDYATCEVHPGSGCQKPYNAVTDYNASPACVMTEAHFQHLQATVPLQPADQQISDNLHELAGAFGLLPAIPGDCAGL